MPMYPEIMVVPMREELTRLGVEELRTVEEVDGALKNRPGTTMVVVNSICGCAAGRMRPAVRMALAEWRQARQGFLRVRRSGEGSHGPCPRLFHGLSTIVAFDCDPARRATGLHDAAPRYRIARSPGDCGRPESCVRPLLREARTGPIVIVAREPAAEEMWLAASLYGNLGLGSQPSATPPNRPDSCGRPI